MLGCQYRRDRQIRLLFGLRELEAQLDYEGAGNFSHCVIQIRAGCAVHQPVRLSKFGCDSRLAGVKLI
jgi:hypothetical protein